MQISNQKKTANAAAGSVVLSNNRPCHVLQKQPQPAELQYSCLFMQTSYKNASLLWFGAHNRDILIKAWAMQKIETQAPIAWGISNSLTHALENKESRIAPLKNDWRCSRPSYCLFEIHRWWTQVLFLWVGNLFLLCIPFEGLNHPTRIILAIKPVLNSTLRICRIKNNMQ